MQCSIPSSAMLYEEDPSGDSGVSLKKISDLCSKALSHPSIDRFLRHRSAAESVLLLQNSGEENWRLTDR